MRKKSFNFSMREIMRGFKRVTELLRLRFWPEWFTMEFSFNINELLPNPVTVVDDKLAPFRARVKNDRCDSS